MIKVGIIGFGFMGAMHFRCYNSTEGVKIAALCDPDKSKFEADSGTAGNIAGAEGPLDLSGVELYYDARKMISEASLDAVSITLPTNLHTEYTKLALDSGLNVLCEKPMALNLEQCSEMIAAADKSGKILQIGQCIRFWPEYAKAKELVDSGKYGKVKVASFQRLASVPTYSVDNWLMDASKSGGASMDLNVHDVDFVQYLFGMPKAVYSRAVKGPSGEAGHIVTQYDFDNDQAVTTEAGWLMAPGFGFEMSFSLILEKATIIYDFVRDPSFKVYPLEGEAFTPELAAGDGYTREIAHFVKAVAGQSAPEIVTPAQAMNSVKLALAEKQSAASGEKVSLA